MGCDLPPAPLPLGIILLMPLGFLAASRRRDLESLDSQAWGDLAQEGSPPHAE